MATKEQSAEASGKTRKKDSTRKGGTSHDTMQDSPEDAVPPPRWSERLARKSLEMELDDSNSDEKQGAKDAGPPPPPDRK